MSMTIIKQDKITNEVLTIEAQIEILKAGKKYINLYKECTIDDGIKHYTEEEIQFYLDFYHTKNQFSISSFVPASGAGSRMFKCCFEEDDTAFLSFLKQIKQTAIGVDLLTIYPNFEHFSDTKQKEVFLAYYSENLEDIPKGLIPFHLYENTYKTAFIEHLEAFKALGIENGIIHFTVQKEFHHKIQQQLEEYVKAHHLNIKIHFSYQDENTNTISLDKDTDEVVYFDQDLFLRPAGHGALLQNINQNFSDISFIKNIDNIQYQTKQTDSLQYKKVLIGHLASLKIKINNFLNAIETAFSDVLKQEMILSIQKDFQDTYLDFSNWDKNNFIEYFNRPLRVCGMVENTGEPGGGPFWVLDNNKIITKQIVEKQQINIENASQNDILKKSTHFNPVDIVYSITDKNGKVFDLQEYVDEETYLISQKSKNGRDFNILEYPGLWNGSMSNWISVFVEVPLSTFSPVKSVLDLLNHKHTK